MEWIIVIVLVLLIAGAYGMAAWMGKEVVAWMKHMRELHASLHERITRIELLSPSNSEPISENQRNLNLRLSILEKRLHSEQQAWNHFYDYLRAVKRVTEEVQRSGIRYAGPDFELTPPRPNNPPNPPEADAGNGGAR